MFVLVPTLVGATQLLVGGGWLLDEWKLQQHSAPRTGKVVGHEPTPTGQFRARVQFTGSAGTAKEFLDVTGSSTDLYPVGSEVRVREPADGREPFIDGWFMRFGFPGVFVLAGSLVLLFAAIRLRIALKPA